MKGRILVTGATGNVGSFLIERLKNAGVPYMSASPNVKNPNDSEVRFDFTDRQTFNFSGFDRVFLMRPPQITNIRRDMLPALEWFKEIGVRHIVVMSVQGAQDIPWIPHRKLELEVIKIGLPHTFLRPSFFMQNLTGVHAHEVKEKDELFVPAGLIGMSFIDAKDIAEASFKILCEPLLHSAKSYTLTGPEVLTYHEVAAILSSELGRRIIYSSPSVLKFAAAMRRRSMDWSYIFVMIGLYLASRFRPPNRIFSDLERVVGHKGTTLREFIRREKAVWT